MQAWWAENNYLKNIKNLAVQKLLIGSVSLPYSHKKIQIHWHSQNVSSVEHYLNITVLIKNLAFQKYSFRIFLVAEFFLHL